MKQTSSLILLLLSLFVTGCANGPNFTAEHFAATDGSNLYVYRPEKFLSGGLAANVYIDEKPAGILRNNGYLKLSLGDGNHTIRIGHQQHPIVLSNSDKLFFRYTYGWDLFFLIPIVPDSLEPVEQGLALHELQETNLSN